MVNTIKITDYITQTEAASIIGVNRQTIWKLMKAGKIAVADIAGQQYIVRSSAEAIRDERQAMKQESQRR